ncbi:MAG TPA: hypothetical protein VFW94_12350 [Candidatus Acidoferrales bacterium]|nr:hypothetical protein [Candidatus Acidoferrales bacterium]
MNSHREMNPMRCRPFGLLAAASAVLMFALGAPVLHAADPLTKCQRDTEKAEAKLDKAVAEHGKHSHEAAKDEENLRKQRETCYEHIHEWWDGKDQKWHHDDDYGTDLHNHGPDSD